MDLGIISDKMRDFSVKLGFLAGRILVFVGCFLCLEVILVGMRNEGFVCGLVRFGR